MARIIRNLIAMMSMAAASGAMADTPNKDELRACLTAAATKHLQAKTVLFSSISKAGIPQLTIDFYLSQRRLDETYCSEYARCVVAFTKPATELAGIVAGTQFSGCLADEAKEGADAEDK
jgi:hypothetical protein